MNEEIIENLNERLDRTIDKGRALITEDEIQQHVEVLKDQVCETVKTHPIKSVVAGFAVGFLLAKLFSSED